MGHRAVPRGQHEAVPGVADVDHAGNGFNPSDILWDFDYGKVSTLANGQTLREFEIVALNKEIEVVPGINFAAWTYNGRIPGPTLRASEGDRVRVRFFNGSNHPHSMHFHGFHPSEMDGVPGTGGIPDPGKEFVYEFDAEPFEDIAGLGIRRACHGRDDISLAEPFLQMGIGDGRSDGALDVLDSAHGFARVAGRARSRDRQADQRNRH